MRLQGRLLTMANMVEIGESVADIGTDHGLLPIFLAENNISSKLIMTDVNTGPLNRAKENFRAFLPDFHPDLRLGDGLDPLEKGEVDAVIIAGMGGELIENILENDFEKTKSFKKFILQPRTKIADLRKFLHNNAFEIIEEKLVREGKIICEIILAIPGAKKRKNYGEMDLEVSPLLFSSQDPLLEEFIRVKIDKEMHIVSEIRNKGSSDSFHKLEKAEERIRILRRILNEHGGGNEY